jgi:hypothetical protein
MPPPGFKQSRFNSLRQREPGFISSVCAQEVTHEQRKTNGRSASKDRLEIHQQTDKPWKGQTEKEQKPGGPPPDLEKWHDTNTH